VTVVVLMGVTGSGKSTVGPLLAQRLNWPFQDGDDLHPPANVAKMAAGHPLTDEDRRPWLARVRDWIAAHDHGVITCSALKRAYRDVLRDEHVAFVQLSGTREQLTARLAARQGHFMPAALLDSQLADLEPPETDERAITVDIGTTPTVIAATIVDRLAAE
jgi:carbohydrate kinase (thermoresistant glucokinase family)